MLLKHHLDYKTNLTTLMCQDCHYKEHFPQGKQDKPLLPGTLAGKQILEIDDSGHFGKKGGQWVSVRFRR